MTASTRGNVVERWRWTLRTDPPTGLPDLEVAIWVGWLDWRVGWAFSSYPSERTVTVQLGPMALTTWWRPLADWRRRTDRR